MKSTFYFTLQSLFALNVFKFLSWISGHVEKPASLERYLKNIKFCDFRDFWPLLRYFLPAKSFKTTKSQNYIPTKLNTVRVWDSLFPNIGSKYNIDTRISHISTYSNKTRVSVTYLITITLINNRQTDIQWGFRCLFYNEIPKLNTREVFFNHQIAKWNTHKM